MPDTPPMHRPQVMTDRRLRVAAHERAAQPRVQARRPRRGHVLARLQVRGAPGGDRAQARAGDGRAQGRSRCRAPTSPNEYAVWLSPRGPRAVRGLRGRAARASCRATCSSTRAASGSRCVTPRRRSRSRPTSALRLGEFGIQARLVRPHDDAELERPSQGDEGHTMVYSTSERHLRAAARARSAPRAARGCASTAAPSCSAPAARCSAARASATSCSTTPTCPASHAEVRPSGGSWIVRDLGSTNGVKVNGRARSRAPAVARARRRDRARHLARRLRAGVGRVMLDPVAVALKFGFLAVLYLFLLWMARSALTRPAPRRRRRRRRAATRRTTPPACTSPRAALDGGATGGAPRLRVETRRGPARRLGLRPLRRRAARARRPGRHRARGLVRLDAACPARAARGRHGAGGPRLDERDVPERRAAARSAAAARGRHASASATPSSPSSADAMLRIAEHWHGSDLGPPAAGQRGQLLRPRAAVRGRRRHGRRAGRRGRVRDGGRARSSDGLPDGAPARGARRA